LDTFNLKKYISFISLIEQTNKDYNKSVPSTMSVNTVNLGIAKMVDALRNFTKKVANVFSESIKYISNTTYKFLFNKPKIMNALKIFKKKI
jgi:hypothetical protein